MEVSPGSLIVGSMVHFHLVHPSYYNRDFHFSNLDPLFRFFFHDNFLWNQFRAAVVTSSLTPANLWRSNPLIWLSSPLRVEGVDFSLCELLKIIFAEKMIFLPHLLLPLTICGHRENWPQGHKSRKFGSPPHHHSPR